MKLSYFLGTLLLLGAGSFVLTEATFATDDQTVATPAATVAITKPSAQSITAAITKVQNIGAYRTHFSGNNPSPLTSDVTFYQEYNYLLSLVKTAQNLLANYDTATVDQLNEIIAAANDAEIACNLLFGINRQINHRPQTPAATAQPALTSSSNAAPVAQQSPAPAPVTKTAPVTTTTAAEVNQQDAVTDNGAALTVSVHVGAPASAESAEPLSEAATLAAENSDETDNQTPALALAHTATATVTSCALGTLYLKERRTYRPGRH